MSKEKYKKIEFFDKIEKHTKKIQLIYLILIIILSFIDMREILFEKNNNDYGILFFQTILLSVVTCFRIYFSLFLTYLLNRLINRKKYVNFSDFNKYLFPLFGFALIFRVALALLLGNIEFYVVNKSIIDTIIAYIFKICLSYLLFFFFSNYKIPKRNILIILLIFFFLIGI